MKQNTTREAEMKAQQKVNEAERNYFQTRDAEPDHRWGEPQEIAFGRACDELAKAYDEAGTPDIDRIQL